MVNPAVTATTVAAPAASTLGQSVTATATVAPVAPGSGTPSGTVEFFVDGVSQGTAALSGGSASLNLGALALGNRAITAQYGGATDFNGSTSISFSHDVRSVTTTTLTAVPVSPAPFGAPHKFTVRVNAGAGTPTGTVRFFINGSQRRSRPLNAAGAVVFSFARLPFGPHTLRAEFAGDTGYAASGTGDVAYAVGKADTVTELVITPSPSRPGEGYDLTASVTVSPPGTGEPNGTVRFFEGRTLIYYDYPDSAEARPEELVSQSYRAVYSGSSRYKQSEATVHHEVSPRVGPQVAVNTTTANDQHRPDVTWLPGVGHVIVWESLGQDGSGAGIYAQRYDLTGAPLGTEFRVNTTTNGDQTHPAVAAFGDGGFIVVWTGLDADRTGVFFQRYDATGNAVGSETLANSTTSDRQEQPDVAVADDGSFGIVWQSRGQDGSGFGIYTRTFNSAGLATGGEVLVNNTTLGNQIEPALALRRPSFGSPVARFAVVWRSLAPDGSQEGIFGSPAKHTGTTRSQRGSG